MNSTQEEGGLRMRGTSLSPTTKVFGRSWGVSEDARKHQSSQGWQRVAVVISDNREDVHGKLPSRTWSHW